MFGGDMLGAEQGMLLSDMLADGGVAKMFGDDGLDDDASSTGEVKDDPSIQNHVWFEADGSELVQHALQDFVAAVGSNAELQGVVSQTASLLDDSGRAALQGFFES